MELRYDNDSGEWKRNQMYNLKSSWQEALRHPQNFNIL
ncbi:hypothetical protein T4B_1388 [Trichinella pseudospiralis]|uniref:Uncharacterized protein n=1 Tax=Trichinella pseudospiralis TaxID=6337 RepID=A0A0V1GH92_TRIPS|nr:hypothetical protein T4B_5781 [Trichinella pseudospiralis]KRY96068.1 hypothetical protein T4B_1388 [Trichinella pseudospiralis]KRY97577.1 hypothetical protein T4C_718 [Trichinella pseudospiralis]KRY97580.1 hypothetical protein T4C_2107 [Trichinella pseudospiralis]